MEVRSAADSPAGGLPPAPGPEVAEAQRRARALDPGGALAVLERAGGLDARAPERSWMLLDLLEARGRAREARARADALPSSPVAGVLRAHAAADPEARLAVVERLFGSSAGAWARLEAATAAFELGGQPEAVIAHARRAAAAGPDFVRREAALLAARAALDADRGAEAARFADDAAAVDPADPRAPALLSRIASRRGRRDEAVLAAVTALRLQPRSPRAARRVADFLRQEPGPEVEARVREAVASIARGAAPSAEVEALQGLVAERAGDLVTARARYRAALARGADPIPVEHRLRVLLAGDGDVRGMVGLLRGAVPPEVIADPENELRGAWEELFRRAAALPVRTANAPAGALDDLADALVRVGGVEEAAALLGPAASPRGRATREACLREIRFERALRRAVEDGYHAPAEGRDPPSFESLLGTIRDLAREHLDPEAARAFDDPARGRRSVPLLGDWLDHGVRTTSPVVAHFRRFGRYVLVGRVERKVPEVILLSLASLAPGATVRTQGYLFHHDVAVGYDRAISSYVDFQGGYLSGAALPDAVWLDADAARREDHGLREALALDPTIGPELDRAAADPSPPDGIDGVLATDEPQLLGLRLLRRYVARVGADPWGSFHALRAHEYGHVLDLERHLPIGRGLPATVALAASEGFALRRIEARLEGRAQLAAVRDGRDPDLALVDLVRSFPNYERVPEAHDRGYRAVAEAILRRLLATADAHPAIDPARKLLPQLDRLTPEAIRALGEDVGRTGFTVR